MAASCTTVHAQHQPQPQERPQPQSYTTTASRTFIKRDEHSGLFKGAFRLVGLLDLCGTLAEQEAKPRLALVRQAVVLFIHVRLRPTDQVL